MNAPQRQPHCPHCGRGSNFKLPKITIDWEQINRQQFEAARASLRERIDHFLDCEKADRASGNWWSRADALLIQALLNAAESAPLKVDEGT